MTRNIRRALIDHFPEQRKELDAWLAPELIGANEDVVRRLLVERLEKRLPGERSILPSEERPCLRLGILSALGALVLVGFALGYSPFGVQSRYLGGLFACQRPAPLVIEEVEPADGWVRSGVAVRLRIRFDREFTGDGRVRIDGDPGAGFPLLRLGPGSVYEAALPPLSGDQGYVVEAEGRTGARVNLRVFPDDVLALVRATIIERPDTPSGADDARLTTLLPSDFPVSLDEGTKLKFELELRDCPVLSVGLSGHFRGDVPLVQESPLRLSATVTVRSDEIYSLLWTYPDGTHAKKGFFPVRRRREKAPRLKVVAPLDGTRVLPGRAVRIEVECEYDRPVMRMLLLGSDYHGMTFSREVAMTQAERGGVSTGSLKLRIEDLPLATGRAIGICAASVPPDRAQAVALSDIVNLIFRGEEGGDNLALLASADTGTGFDEIEPDVDNVFEWDGEGHGEYGPEDGDPLIEDDPREPWEPDNTDDTVDDAEPAPPDDTGIDDSEGTEGDEGGDDNSGEGGDQGEDTDDDQDDGDQDEGDQGGDDQGDDAEGGGDEGDEGDEGEGGGDEGGGDEGGDDEGGDGEGGGDEGGGGEGGGDGGGGGEGGGGEGGGGEGGGKGGGEGGGGEGGGGKGGGGKGGGEGGGGEGGGGKGGGGKGGGGEGGGGKGGGEGGSGKGGSGGGSSAPGSGGGEGGGGSEPKPKDHEDDEPIDMPHLGSGSKEKAGRVKGGTTVDDPEKPGRRPRRSDPALRFGKVPDPDGAGVAARAGLAGNTVRASTRKPLSPSEREKEISKFDDFCRQLDVGDRRVVQEYLRLLRDIR